MGKPWATRRKLLVGAGAGLAAIAAGVAFWPTRKERAAYPFARRLYGKHQPLWDVKPAELAQASENDAARLERLLPQLDRAVATLEQLEPRLANAQVGELGAADRDKLRELWFQVFEPILAIDAIKGRYDAWWGLDYQHQRALHARAYALCFAAFCGQVDAGLRLLAAIADKKLLPVLFDEAMPNVGLPARTFSGLRERIGRTRDLWLVPIGDEWYERWLLPHVRKDGKLGEVSRLLDTLRARTKQRVWTPTSQGIANKADIVRGELFERWFPLQKGFAEWAGDTRFARAERRLIDDAALAAFQAKLEPGDIILERRNWYLSNVGLPGFWPHAALYVGTQAQILKALAEDSEVKNAFGDLRAHYEKLAPKAWASLAERDHGGHEHRILEAVSEGVVSASVQHSCGADYVAALRPRLPPLARARAIGRALAFWGRPYDFNFDFLTDDQLVCSELVVKAYEKQGTDGAGLAVPYVELVGRRAVPPTELVRLFRDQRNDPNRQLDFVYFLEGRESERTAVVADADALASTCDRPKWDLVQP
jgi:hypothetical protein